jgi:DNA repair exonuclease SbcCD ATPase subunit
MKKHIIGLALLALAAAPAAHAQEGSVAAGCIVPEQAQQLIATLKQRNDQLREMSEKMRAMEAEVAAARSSTGQIEASRKAIAIAAEKNRELRDLGNAIIADYEKMDLGKKMAASEPLTGLYRVRLENKLQEFSDQVAALGFYPDRDAVSATPAPTTP